MRRVFPVGVFKTGPRLPFVNLWQPPGAARGVDVDASGNGTATEQRLYQLIRQPRPIVDRTFAIELLDAGVEAYAFTFG